MANKKPVLIVGPSWVGDMIMAQSLFKQMLKMDETIEISVLCPKWSSPILKRMPEVKRMIEMDVGHGKLDLSTRRRIADSIKEFNFQQAIILPGSLKSALIPYFANIPIRTGYRGEMRYKLVNDIRRLNKTALPTTVQRFVNLVSANPSLQQCPKPELQIDHDQARALKDKFSYVNNKPLLVLCPGAEYGPAKRWPAQRFAQLATRRVEMGWQIWIIGSNNDKEICDIVNRLSDEVCQNLVGLTSLNEVVDILSIADAVITNDSGLMHMAAAINKPLISIYGSSSKKMTPALSDKSIGVTLNLNCSPCFKRTCPYGHMNCLYDISAEQVNNHLQQIT